MEVDGSPTVLPHSHGNVDLQVGACTHIHMDGIGLLATARRRRPIKSDYRDRRRKQDDSPQTTQSAFVSLISISISISTAEEEPLEKLNQYQQVN